MYRDNVPPRVKWDPTYDLSEQEAFQALTIFLSAFYRRAGDDMATLLADIEVESDGDTRDPAAWDDWVDAVRAVKGASPSS